MVSGALLEFRAAHAAEFRARRIFLAAGRTEHAACRGRSHRGNRGGSRSGISRRRVLGFYIFRKSFIDTGL